MFAFKGAARFFVVVVTLFLFVCLFVPLYKSAHVATLNTLKLHGLVHF